MTSSNVHSMNYTPGEENRVLPTPSVATIALGAAAPLNGLMPGIVQEIMKPVAARKWYAFSTQGQLALTQPELAADTLMSICDYYTFAIYQTLIGPTMIGRFGLKTKKRISTLMELVADSPLSQMQVFGCAATGEDPAFYEDDSKDGTAMSGGKNVRIRGPWSHLTHGLEIPDYVQRMVKEGMRPWQQKVVESIAKREERIVNFVVDTRGNTGKSTMGMWLLCHGYGRRLACTSSPKELSAMVLASPKKQCFMVDLPRAFRNRQQLESLFGAIEEIKNGFAEEHRYHYQVVTFQPPAVWVFANALPDLSFLSMDRWRIWEMRDMDLVPHPHAVSLVSAALSQQYRGRPQSAYTAGDQFTSAVVRTASGEAGPADSAALGGRSSPTSASEWETAFSILGHHE